MISQNGNGSFRVAFWVMASICGVWLVLLTNGVVANDRLRAEVDLAQTSTISELRESSVNIKGELVRINTKLDKLLGWEYEDRRKHET